MPPTSPYISRDLPFAIQATSSLHFPWPRVSLCLILPLSVPRGRYIICGTPEFALHSYRDLPSRIELICDGEPVALPPNIEGLMICNTPSYALPSHFPWPRGSLVLIRPPFVTRGRYGGGSDLWDEARGAPLQARTDRFATPPARRASMSDGCLEVVGVTDVVHLAFSLGGLSNGVRLCQGASISVKCADGGVPLQIDGEPCNLTPAGPLGSEPFELHLAYAAGGTSKPSVSRPSLTGRV